LYHQQRNPPKKLNPWWKKVGRTLAFWNPTDDPKAKPRVFIGAANEELKDAYSPIYDQLDINPLWNVLEVWPWWYVMKQKLGPGDKSVGLDDKSIRSDEKSIGSDDKSIRPDDKIIWSCKRVWNKSKGRTVDLRVMGDHGIRVHRSVRTRMLADCEKGKEYWPLIRREVEVEPGKVKSVRFRRGEWLAENPKDFKWVD